MVERVTRAGLSICGYQVVRARSRSFDEQGRGAYSARTRAVGAVEYGGIERMPWFDLDEDYYGNRLPASLKDLRQELKSENSDISGIEVLRDYDAAARVYSYVNDRNPGANEIIALDSRALADIKGGALEKVPELEFLGYDVVCLGEWSLLANGVFVKPELFPEVVASLNESGLCPTEKSARSVESLYKEFSRAGALEEISDDLIGVEIVGVFRAPTPRIRAADGGLPC